MAVSAKQPLPNYVVRHHEVSGNRVPFLQPSFEIWLAAFEVYWLLSDLRDQPLTPLAN